MVLGDGTRMRRMRSGRCGSRRSTRSTVTLQSKAEWGIKKQTNKHIFIIVIIIIIFRKIRTIKNT